MEDSGKSSPESNHKKAVRKLSTDTAPTICAATPTLSTSLEATYASGLTRCAPRISFSFLLTNI